MTNRLYPKGKERLLGGQIDLDTDPIKAALVSTSASYSASHEFWSSLSSNVVGTPQTLSSVTLTDGVFNASNTVFTAVTGSPVGSVVLFKDTGNASTSPLLAWVDTTSAGAISVTPNGGNISVNWDTGSSKIFAI